MSRPIDENTICEAAERPRQAAPGSTVILFGSCARGDYGPDSDADFLVIEPEVTSRHEEMVRLRDVLRPLRIPVDVVVASARVFEEWSGTPGTLYYEARQEGKVFDVAQAPATVVLFRGKTKERSRMNEIHPQYVVDDQGTPRSVLLEMREFEELLECVQDVLDAEEIKRLKNEPRIPWAKVKRQRGAARKE